MNYELAKQLKDAGFPVKDGARNMQTGKVINYKVPTLSELVAACGFEFIHLVLDDGRFYALGHHLDTFAEKFGEGDTPEEAVAKLWLQLNANNDRGTTSQT